VAAERLSYMVSEFHSWFVEMGYPELDILRYDDGEWHIIQYYNRPVVPALTRWQPVLGPMRNVLITRSFCEKYVKDLDITKKAFWAREEAKTKEVEREHAAEEKRRVEYVDVAHRAITKNPNLMNRIASKGIQEMDIPSIARHVPRSEVVKSTIKGETVNGTNEHEPASASPSGGDAPVCSAGQPAQ
jgi:hypothetical protein